MARRKSLIVSRSTRFIVFDQYAKIICEHQAEFEQILPHAGWHEQNPEDLVDCMRECINKAVEKLEWMGWKKESIKGIGEYAFYPSKYRCADFVLQESPIREKLRYVGLKPPGNLCVTPSSGMMLVQTVLFDNSRRNWRKRVSRLTRRMRISPRNR